MLSYFCYENKKNARSLNADGHIISSSHLLPKLKPHTSILVWKPAA